VWMGDGDGHVIWIIYMGRGDELYEEEKKAIVDRNAIATIEQPVGALFAQQKFI